MEDIRFAHYRVLNTKTNEVLTTGGVTLAVAKINDNLYRVAGAKCHEADHYCKKNGRAKAKGRLLARNSFRYSKPNKNTGVVRLINWIELDHKPSLETLTTIAETFFGNYLQSGQELVNSGVFNKKD